MPGAKILLFASPDYLIAGQLDNNSGNIGLQGEVVSLQGTSQTNYQDVFSPLHLPAFFLGYLWDRGLKKKLFSLVASGT